MAKLKIPEISSIKSIIQSKTVYAVLFFLLMLVPFSIFASMRTGFCGSCHAVKKEFNSWKTGSHSKASCISCHQKPGVAGFVEYMLGGVGNLSKWVLSSNETVVANVDDKSCNRCHSSISEIVLSKKGISVSHQHFTNVGFRCTDCHNTVAHGAVVPRQNFASIDKCVICHDGKKVKKYPRLFDADRKGLTPWSVVHKTNGAKNHGIGNLSTCQGCHSQKFCSKCHKVELPHNDTFTYEHGKLSLKKDSKCYSCHKRDLCNNCHKISMPHPTRWLAKHSNATPVIGEKNCERCHSKNDCFNCHEKHVHPGQGKNGEFLGL